MTDLKKRKLKRIIFPIGIFFLLFLIESVIGIGGVASYIYLAGKKNIADIESYTINYSKTMAEAFADVAEFSYLEKKYAAALKKLFHEKIEAHTIDEAFFVLANGKIVVHSKPKIEEKLRKNIFDDEMSYPKEMILNSVHAKSNDLISDNYNITDKFVPFRRWERDIISKYIYPDLNTTGWLFSKWILHKKKPIGTVNFIISKERIYTSIRESIDLLKFYSIMTIAISAVISFFISLIVFFRYRSIQLNALQHDHHENYSIERNYPIKPTPIKSAPKHDKIKFRADTLMDDYMGDDSDDADIDFDIIEEEIERIDERDLTEVYEPKRSSGQIYDDEYITVEFLGEIEPDKRAAADKKRPERAKESVNSNNYKKKMNKEIRDAIPIRNKARGKDVFY
jgi:hypothetical protein